MIETLFKAFLKKTVTVTLTVGALFMEKEMTGEEFSEQLEILRNTKDTPIEVSLNPAVTLKINSYISCDVCDYLLINKLYNKAIKYIDVAIYELRNFLKKLSQERNVISPSTHDEVKPLILLLEKNFHIDFDQHIKKTRYQIHQLVSKLEATRNGLYAEHNNLYIANLSKIDLLSAQYDGAAQLLGKTKPDDNDAIIYINFSLLSNNHQLFISTLIHEASHLFAKTEDYDYYNWKDMYRGTINRLMFNLFEYICPEMHPDYIKFLNHANSLEIFVMELVDAKKSLHHTVDVDEQFQDRQFDADNYSKKTLLQT